MNFSRTLSRIVIVISSHYLQAGEAIAAHADRLDMEKRERRDRSNRDPIEGWRKCFYAFSFYEWVDAAVIFPLIALKKTFVLVLSLISTRRKQSMIN